MASGRQLAEQNFATFTAWVASKTDGDFRAIAKYGGLSRTEIAKECGFAKSALGQNPKIRTALHELEGKLRVSGVLPPAVENSSDEAAKPLMREPGILRAASDAKRLQRLETENASLKAENKCLKVNDARQKAENAELKRALEKLSILREALAAAGRVPR